VKLWRCRVGATQDGDTNTWHRRLPLVPVKLPSSSATTDGRRHGGFKAAAALGFRGRRAQGLGRRLVFGWGAEGVRRRLIKARGDALACGPHGEDGHEADSGGGAVESGSGRLEGG
jgi:hypothetical protein